MAVAYNKQFNIGDRLILELISEEIFEGLYAEGGKDRIVLTNLVQHNNQNKLSDLYEFYRGEIAKIHRLKAPPTKDADDEVKKKPIAVEETCTTIKVCQEEYFRLKDMSRDFIYLENADKRYFDAVKVLSDSETVGVVSLGMENNSASVLPLLVLCNWKQVYIFDLSNIEKRELHQELKEILESEYICKVMHKSAGLVDVLYRHYKVYVQNTFDTQIIDLMLQRKESEQIPLVERDLSECLVHYLNFPSSLLQRALNVQLKSWSERPLSDKKKLYASQIATYLIVLKNHFQKLLLQDIYNTISTVQDRVYDMDDFQFLNYNSKKEVPPVVENLIPDLKQLYVGKSKQFLNGKSDS